MCDLLFVFYFSYFISEHYPSQGEVVSAQLDDAIILDFPSETVRILSQYSEKVSKYGLAISTDANRVAVTRIPVCFLDRHTTEVQGYRPSSLRGLVTNLLEEIASDVIETGGAVGLLPKTIRNLLNSQACRGTVNKHVRFNIF